MIYLYISPYITNEYSRNLLFLKWEYVYTAICGSKCEILNWIIIESEKDVYLVFCIMNELFCISWSNMDMTNEYSRNFLFLEWEYVSMTICGFKCEMLNWIIIESEKMYTW